MTNQKLKESLNLLFETLERIEESSEDNVLHAACSKAFESAFEYSWKHFKQMANDSGLEVNSPREAIRAAGQLKIIESAERWNDYLNTRNLCVHDYVGTDERTTLLLIRRFAEDVRKLISQGLS